MQISHRMSPFVSIIVPIYNVEEYLEACLESLERQTLQDIEVLMIDDGSPDRSFEICQNFESRDSRFRYFRKENGGLSDARNYGVEKARGEFIAFVDSDDIVANDIYEHMHARIVADESDFAICAVTRFNSKKKWDSTIHTKAFFNTPNVTNIHKSNQLFYDTTAWNKLIRRSFWDKHGFSFPVGMLYEDIPVTMPMHCLAEKVSVLQECGYFWRARDGAITSITQNVADPDGRNFHDRLMVMRMVNDFFEKNVSDESLLLTKSIKYLDTDLFIFLVACARIEEEQAQRMFSGLIDFIQEAVDLTALQHLSVLDQQRYNLLFARDYEGLKALTEFAPLYKKTEVRDTGNDLIVNLPDNLFSIKNRSIKREIMQMPPSVYVDGATLNENECVLNCHLYKQRVNIRKGDLAIEATLINDRTCATLPLTVVAEDDTRITDIRGLVFDKASNKEVHYCYDGVCFSIVLDLKEIAGLDALSGTNRIILNYSTKYYKGRTVLRGIASEAASLLVNKAFMFEASTVSFSKSFVSDLVLTTNQNIALCNISQDAESIILESEQNHIYVEDETGVRFALEKTGGVFLLDPDRLYKDHVYRFFIENANEKASPVCLKKKGVEILAVKNTYCAVDSTMDFVLKIHRIESHTRILKATKNKKTTTLKLKHFGAKSEKTVEKLSILSEGRIECAYVPLCPAEKTGKDTFTAKIDFSNQDITSNLYSSNRFLYAQVMFADGTNQIERIYSEKYFKRTYKEETLAVTLYRSAGGSARMISTLKWSASQDTAEKRSKIIRDEYPEMMKLPLDSKLILFESSWGASYSCNPQAIYECIQEKYPGYKCVWAFNDPRTPIKGNAKRIRRHSREYYECLAQAKFLVNNVNFPDSYIKRNGQIELQTMHGTPLKTFGLEIAQEMTSENARQRLIERNSRWNYLVVQGAFMEKKAFDCFEYTGPILKTGYPRTDKLMTASAKKSSSVKQDLGIPADKKVILYAPTWRIRNRFDMRLDLDKMKAALGDEYVILIRLHHMAASKGAVNADNEFSFDVTSYQSIEDLCIASDALITDYSSIMFDYALTDKPMIFYLYDLKEYRDTLRGLYVDIEEEAPGPIAYTTQQVINAIKNESINEDKIKAFKAKYLTYENDHSSEMVAEQLLRPRLSLLKNALRKLKRQ